MNAFQVYNQIKSYLRSLPPEKVPFISESTFLESSHFLHLYLEWYFKQKKCKGIDDNKEISETFLEELDLKFNIKQKKEQTIILQTLDLLSFLLLELGRPDLTMFMVEIEEQRGNWLLGISPKKLNEKLGIFQFLIELVGPNRKKHKSIPSTRPNSSSCNESIISSSETVSSSLGISQWEDSLGPTNYLEKTPDFNRKASITSNQDWSDIGAYRLAYLQSQNDQLSRQLQNVSCLSPCYPPYPVRKVNENLSPIPASKRKKKHALEQTLYRLYPCLLQTLHCLDIYYPSLSKHSSQSVRDSLMRLRTPLSKAIFECMKYDYEVPCLDREGSSKENVENLLDVDTCIQEVTSGITISPQFYDKLEKRLTCCFDKVKSQMDLIRLENQAYKEEHEHLSQTVAKEIQEFQLRSSNFHTVQKTTQSKLSCISNEMESLLKQMETLKLNYSNEDALTMLKVIETLLQRWQPELDELGHYSLVPSFSSPSP